MNLTGADLRGAYTSEFFSGFFGFFGANWTNAIRPDGRITGLHLTNGEFLNVYEYDGDPDRDRGPVAPIPVFIDSSLTMDGTGLLRFIFEADAWDSTISFQPGIPISLGGGTLELTFAEDVDLASQLGRTFDLFDWTGASPTGTFAVSSPYQWDVSRLYTTGEVTLLAVREPAAVATFLIGVLVLVSVRAERLAGVE